MTEGGVHGLAAILHVDIPVPEVQAGADQGAGAAADLKKQQSTDGQCLHDDFNEQSPPLMRSTGCASECTCVWSLVLWICGVDKSLVSSSSIIMYQYWKRLINVFQIISLLVDPTVYEIQCILYKDK